MKISLTFCLTKKNNTCHNAQNTIKADKNPLRKNIQSKAKYTTLLDISHKNQNVYFQKQ